ncbi:Subtilisin inhibitor-like protein 7 [Nonomuraea coxensis DSM 45129]|uniref:Subtilisin inhibitor-like protein 7 n=1 Tax=Nonomuraea coxensis DSM 45129 TaxID=1122611 RepID=A0ABX8UA25_9ACTN|nr:SSI family serine proteinase inhibitor [Nonomuraea coxensis]QYC43689.1 Subtilisin inhibitor-like protein 7 [Nonomuraea coxensis DSM 45129]
MKAAPTALRTALRTTGLRTTGLRTTGLRGAAAGLCAAVLVAVPLAAAPASAAGRAGADLAVTVTGAGGSGAYRYLLTCDPTGGSHPRPADACAALHSVGGRVDALDVDPGPCTQIHAPVHAEVAGRWYGRPIAYHHDFPNRCLMIRTLGPVV